MLHNTLWTEDGYDLFVANDSQTGFFSDFNNLYATGTGKVGFWTRDFFDVLDWQADIARFDLHSFGATVVNPDWARPRFVRAGTTTSTPLPDVRHAALHLARRAAGGGRRAHRAAHARPLRRRDPRTSRCRSAGRASTTPPARR